MVCNYYLFLVCLLKLVSCLRLHTNSRLSGFVLVDNNFTYVEELVPGQIDIATDPNSSGVPENRHDAYNPNERDVVSHAKANVRFEPSVLYFKDKIVGNSYRETVYIYNTSQNKTLRMEKIAGGKHSQIQIAAFGDELVAPGGNTTFDIMFIGKDLVPLSTHYYIYTSKGILKYDVVSWCTENPFNISPMSEIILPLNSTYSHPITLRNPFSEPLKIMEVLLHGGTYASHTLPPGIDFENAADLWTIQPYETKEILRVHFLTYEAWNLTTFQSIKLATGTTLLIPVEVEVIPRTGLYVPGNKLDFETGGHLDPPTIRPLHLCSSAKKPVTIENVSCEQRFDGCEVVEFRPTALPPWSCGSGPVAKVKFVWGANPPGEMTSGGLLIKNDLDPLFRINYSARIHHGGLTYNSSLTHYVTGIPSFNSSPRPFTFTNEYRELVAVMNVYLSFEAAEYFHIRGFEPYVLKPQEKKVLFNLQTRKGVKLNELKLDSSILLETNISTIRLPLRVFDGLLTKLSKVAPSSLHLGLVSARTTTITYFGLSNANPEAIFVKYFGCNDSSVRIELLDVKPGHAKTFYYRSFLNNESGMIHSGGFNIHPNHYASFKLEVNTSDSEEEVYAEVWVQSEYQKLLFPLYMNVAKGFLRVSPDPFEFEDCFPGAYCMQQLTVESHFQRSMSIVNISSIPYTSHDKLLFYPNNPALIAGHETSIVGNILWEPTIDTRQAWPLGYLGLPNNKTGRDRWLGTIERPNITRDFDMTLMESQYLRYREQYSSPIDLTFRMDTTEMLNFLFKGRTQLRWPQIVTTRVIDFPLVQVETISYENVSVFNPMHSHYMTVQAIMAQHYQQEVPPVVGTMMSDYEEPGGVESKSNEFFLDMELDSPYRRSVLNGTKRKYTNHRSSLVFVLPPQANATIRIGFMPSDSKLTTTRLYLRNDFTILDSVAINGAGARAELTLENLKGFGDEKKFITFVIPPETLKLCQEDNNRVILNITTKQLLRLHNPGQVSVQIFGFTLNGLACQGYGFKITNCHNTPFTLKPGMTKRIEIVFTPDFTSARILTQLQVETDIKRTPMLSYTLYAALDSDWLRKCKPHLQRPQWEPLIYYLMIGMFFCLLIGVAIMAVYEVSSHTSRIVSACQEIEANLEPIYDTKFIEMLFVRASVPHNHHHHHHHNHHRTSTTCSKSSETTSISWAQSAQQRNTLNGASRVDAVANMYMANLYNADLDYRTKLRLLTTPGTAVLSTPTSSPSSSSSSSSSSSTLPSVSVSTVNNSSELSTREQFIYNLHHMRTPCADKVNDVTTKEDGSEKKGVSGRVQTETSQITHTNRQSAVNMTGANANVDDKGCPKLKKGKKYEFEEVCYKSNWIRKKQAKKEEKLVNGNKFLNNGWAKCLKNNVRTDKCAAHSSGDGSTVCDANSLSSTTASEVASMIDCSAANVSSHCTTTSSNTKFSHKDNVPRKIELNNKLGSKKLNNCSNNSQATSTAIAATQSSVDTPLLSNVAADNKETDCVGGAAAKIAKQKKRKAAETNAKFSTDTHTGESIGGVNKEKLITTVNGCCGVRKAAKEEKSSVGDNVQPALQRKCERTDGDVQALKPITNLPKSKEPFETLSSLCNDSIALKSKRRSNLKKRTKEDKFVNISKHLSIVFATPETLDRRVQTKNENVEKEKEKEKTTVVQQALAASASRNRTDTNQCNQPVARMKNAVNAGLCPSNADEETRMLNVQRINSTGNFLNGELYSRVVASSTSRSSSSSTSSESTASYESSKGVSADGAISSSFWDSWNNDIAIRGGVIPPARLNESISSKNTSKTLEKTAQISLLNSDNLVPTFVVGQENSYPLMGENVFCNDGYHSRQEDREGNSDEEFYNFDDEMSTASVVRREPVMTAALPSTMTITATTRTNSTTLESVANIWSPSKLYDAWTSSDLSGSPSNLTSDTVSAISLSRLLRFDEGNKEDDIEQEQCRSLSSIRSLKLKSLWSHHPKQE